MSLTLEIKCIFYLSSNYLFLDLYGCLCCPSWFYGVYRILFLIYCNLFEFEHGMKVAEFNVQAAQQGIVYIDEVDKITKKV